MKKFEVRISYNPYETEVILMSENKKYDRNNGLHSKPFKELLIIASEKFDNLIQGKDKIHCIFEGRNYEYNLTKSKIESEYKKSSKEISFEHICKYEYNIKEIEEQVKQLPDDLFENASKKQEILRQLHSNIEMYIIGLYSSGKSTFINAMIGESVLYTHSGVATGKLCRIIDNDKNIIEVQTLKDEKQISNKKYQDASAVAAILQELNGDESIDTIKLEIDIPNIDSSHFKLELIDTPGVNNAKSTSHQRMVYDAINNKDTLPPIILVLNPHNFEGGDQDKLFYTLLETIQKVQKDSSEINLERFFFIINRADEIKFEQYERIYENIKDWLEETIGHGAKIYSTNAEYALLIRKEINLKELEEYQATERDGFKKDLKYTQSRMESLHVNTETTAEQIKILEDEKSKIEQENSQITDKKKALETFTKCMEPALKEYQEVIFNLEIDNSKLNLLQFQWAQYIDNLINNEKDKTYSNKEKVKKRVDCIASEMSSKKTEIYSEVNSNMNQYLREKVSQIVDQFYEVIEKNIVYLGEYGESFKKEVKVKFDDKEILFQSKIDDTTRNTDIFDWITSGAAWLFRENYKVDIDSIRKEEKEFQDTLKASRKLLQERLDNIKESSKNNVKIFNEIIESKKQELKNIEEKLKKLAENLKETSDLIAGGENYLQVLEETKKSLDIEFRNLENKVKRREEIIERLDSILNKKDEN